MPSDSTALSTAALDAEPLPLAPPRPAPPGRYASRSDSG
jgi:hypothetical protein